MKQPLLFLSFNYPPTRRLAIILAIVYIKQPLLFLSFNYPQRAGLSIVYIKQPFFIVELSSTRRLHCLH